MRTPITLLALLGLALAQPGQAQAPEPVGSRPQQFTQTSRIVVPLRFDAYYTYEQVGEALRALAAAFPELAQLEVVGTTEEGREIWAMTVNNPKTGAPLTKPGVYVDANIHGNEVQGGEVCLYLLNWLLTGYGTNEQISKVVDRNAFYVIPVVNADGRWHFFHDPNTPSSGRSMRVPRDDDRDGLVDEDFPDDLDGDGSICRMRKKDPFGQWKADPEDPRLLLRIKPGEKGEWTILGEEGLDNDGDGKVNEDAEGYLDGNRNWGWAWAPPYVQEGSGDFPFSAAGPRAVAAYIMARPNIIATYALHNNGGMFLRGPGTKADEPMDPQDVAAYDLLGKNAEKIVPGYRYMVSWKDLYPTYGDFDSFTYAHAGAFSFVTELFQTTAETYRPPDPATPAPAEDDDSDFRPNPERERERLKFSDHVAQGDLFKPWAPFKHPQYGDIEIGGWVKMSSRLPHPFMLADLVHRNAAAVLFAAAETPRIAMEVLSTEKLGAGLHKVRVRLGNSGGLPTRTFQTVGKRTAALDTLTVRGASVKVVAGGKLTDPYLEQVEYKDHKPEVQMVHVPGYGKVEYQFLLSGTGDVTFAFTSLKAGAVSKTITLP
ncbi:MAG: M14 family metallopeptidase [Thermoanaerobaculaceae bacterium]|jgi:hypothetical protein|nr:M14 family metallopeptidase [Thermoanaerobaculaceae bacterium]